MGFNFKEMYSYLLSHTFPGLLFLVEILLFLKFTVYSNISTLFLSDKLIVILILAGYAFSTLLGTMLDAMQHCFFDIIDPDIKKEHIKEKYLAIKNGDKDMGVYKHFIEDDLWYPYEAYANISVAMFLGLILLVCVIIPIPLTLKFWFGIGITFSFLLAALSYEAWYTYKYCGVEEEQFCDVFSKKEK